MINDDTFIEFVNEHGGPPIPDGDFVLLLRDGAQVRGSGMWTYVPPPRDAVRRLKARKRYSECIVELADADLQKIEMISRGFAADPRLVWDELRQSVFGSTRPASLKLARARIAAVREQEAANVAKLNADLAPRECAV